MGTAAFLRGLYRGGTDTPRMARTTIVDRVASLVCGLLGIVLSLLQAFQISGQPNPLNASRPTSVAALCIAVGLSLLCFVQFALEDSRRVLPGGAAVLLVLVTILAREQGIGLRLPGALYGPLIFYLIVCVATEWKRSWPVWFTVGYSIIMPFTANHARWTDALAASLALGVHGLGFRYVIRSTQRHELVVEHEAREAEQRTVAVHSQSVAFLERVHWDAIVHDHVINVLRSGAHAQGDGGEWLRAEARRALALVNAHSSPATETSGQELERRLSAVVRGIAPEALLVIEEACPEARYDDDAAEAIVAAAGEALRNAVRHSGAETIAATAALGPHSMSVRVVDDGSGFDPRRVSPTSMGIRGSIIGRMERAGGSAVVSSQPQEGTTVQLSWDAEP